MEPERSRGRRDAAFEPPRAWRGRIASLPAAREFTPRAGEEMYRLPVYVLLLTPDHRVRFANRFFRHRFGEDRGRRCFEYLFERREPCAVCETFRALSTDVPHRWEWTGPDGRDYDIYDFPFTDVDGSRIVLEMGIDVTERKQTEALLQKAHSILEARVVERTAALVQANAQLRTEIEDRTRADEELKRERDFIAAVLDTAGALVVVLDLHGRIVRFNRACERATGYAFEEVRGRCMWDVFLLPEEVEIVQSVFQRLRAGAFPHEHESHWVGKDGTRRRIVWANTGLLDARGNLEYVVATGIDVTERRLAEEKTMQSLEEKEVLLRELYHRVKNNLQVVSSLLRLQARRIKEPEAAKALAECQGRIQAMALIHEKLYQSSDLVHISFGAYVKTLIDALVRATVEAQGRIAVKTSGVDFTLDISTAIPCGLVLNELLVNAFEHAFPQGRSGEIHVSFRAVDDEQAEVVVRDNGIGLPSGVDLRKADSLGLRLIGTLVEAQLRGSVEIDRTCGTEFRIRFPRARAQAAGA